MEGTIVGASDGEFVGLKVGKGEGIGDGGLDGAGTGWLPVGADVITAVGEGVGGGVTTTPFKQNPHDSTQLLPTSVVAIFGSPLS